VKIRVLAPARREMYRAAVRYDAERRGVGDAFLDQIGTSMRAIREFPDAWPRTHGNIRRFIATRFPYGVLYEVKNDEIVILAIGHLKRGSRYWRTAASRSTKFQ
jgi:plasmid stabilization system protein ParE